MKQPLLVARYADNGEHSHWALINSENGEILWSELMEEELKCNQPKRLPISTSDLAWKAFCYFIFLVLSVCSLVLAFEGNFVVASYAEISSLSVWVICINPMRL